jgi:hypothetical protein
LSSRSELAHLFFGQVARYFSDVSYGKLETVGNATDWITLPKLYSQYVFGNQQIDLASVAQDAFSYAALNYNFTSFNEVYLVLSFYPSLSADYVSLPTRIGTKSWYISSFVAIEEDRDWTTYARGYALMLGLQNIAPKLQGEGQFDTASGGQGDLSALSKIDLGWINDSQVQTFASAPNARIVILDSIETIQSNTSALHIGGINLEGYYLVEARQSVGYDSNNLPAYGVVVVYVPPGNLSVQIKGILRPDDVGKALFLDPASDLSIVALNQTGSGFAVFLGNVQDGRVAQRSLYAISQAENAVQTALVENRIQGLDLANQLLLSARTLFYAGRFTDAEPLALSAETTAGNAQVPADYSMSVQLIAQAEGMKSHAPGLASQQSISMASQANDQLDAAKQAFVARNFTLARQHAQNAVDLYNRAEQLDFTEQVLGWLSSIALIIPVAVLAYAIRFQHKS